MNKRLSVKQRAEALGSGKVADRVPEVLPNAVSMTVLHLTSNEFVLSKERY